MTDRPILFSGPMVRAIAEGRKKQTRRVLTRARVFATPETPAFTLRGSDLARAMQNADRFRRLDGDGWFWEADAFEWQGPALRTGWMAHLGYAPGDRLWVRETWTARMTGGWTIADARSRMFQNEILYAADGDGSIDGWWPSIHMPREFSRLTLTVTDVRVQRLQDISEADAVAEGSQEPSLRSLGGDLAQAARSERQVYQRLWDHLNAKRGYGWDANPWVVALTFTVHHQNIDALGAKEAA